MGKLKDTNVSPLKGKPWKTDRIPNPWLSGSLFVIGLLVCVPIMVRALRSAENIKKGLQGERAVGLYLERLREHGAQVFHDIQGPNFNLDHVIIHASGIYVIETKTMSKRVGGKSELHYDGKHITLAGQRLQSDPVVQVKAGAYWLRELLRESTGHELPVKGVVLFPGWYIESHVSKPEVWVLNAKALPTFIKNEATKLRHDEVFMASFHLSRFIRTL